MTETAHTAHTAHAEGPDDVVLRVEDVSMVFSGTKALDGVDFEVHAGKVNVLIGENGAGKSTLMKILAGVQQPTSGRLLLGGRVVSYDSPREAAADGIGIIYQELNLCPNLSVTENIFVARELTSRGGIVDHKTQERRAAELIAQLRQPILPSAIVEDLPIGQQQIVEIAKALAQDARVLIMDEPTSALSSAEAEALFRVIEELTSRGVAIIYISHKLEELLAIGDYVTVLRDGRVVDTAPAAGIDVAWIVERMVGRRPDSLFQHTERPMGEELLQVEGLDVPDTGGGVALSDVSISVRAGEIVGIYGLMGAGRTELLETLMGLHAPSSGTVVLDGTALQTGATHDRIGVGLMLVPEDRKGAGIVASMSVADNVTLAGLSRVMSRFWLSRRKEREAVASGVSTMTIKTADPRQPITDLSGGNQQKVVLAKALLTEPRVLLLDEPTRGIDVGAKGEIFGHMSRLAERGLGVLFASSELMEILAVADRIIVMSRGQVTGEFTRDEADEQRLVVASAVGHRPVRGAA